MTDEQHTVILYPPKELSDRLFSNFLQLITKGYSIKFSLSQVIHEAYVAGRNANG